jgi:hypothetical protein
MLFPMIVEEDVQIGGKANQVEGISSTLLNTVLNENYAISAKRLIYEVCPMS